MNIKLYLANHSPAKNLDSIIINWYCQGDNKKMNNDQKSKEEWDGIISNFFGETEKDRQDAPKKTIIKEENPKENKMIKEKLKENKPNSKIKTEA